MGLAIVPIDFDGFKAFLLKEKKHRAPQLISYGARYGNILQTGNASQLLTMSESKRRHAMEAITLLAKYSGCYNRWKEIKDKYALKWSSGVSSLKVFESIFNGQNDLPVMLDWLRDTCSKIPKRYAKILIYDTLTGLRPSEACKSIELVRHEASKYVNKERMILEHYKYPEIFLRRTKKAYVSILTEDILALANGVPDYEYIAIRSAIKRRGLDMHMGYCRKIFATHLRMSGIEAEIVDLLQGRIPKQVFARHYFRPDFVDVMNRVRSALDSLHNKVLI